MGGHVCISLQFVCQASSFFRTWGKMIVSQRHFLYKISPLLYFTIGYGILLLRRCTVPQNSTLFIRLYSIKYARKFVVFWLTNLWYCSNQRMQLIIFTYNLGYKTHIGRQDHCSSLKYIWGNYIFILDLTIGSNKLRKDMCKVKWQTLRFWNSVRLILDVWC